MLILDLDDTIFETKSMNPRIFDSAVSLIQAHYEQHYSQAKSKEIITELWSYPVDVVFAKHHTAETLIQKFYQKIEEIDFRELEIKPFEDYREIQKLDEQKVLVTTGLKELQYAKIKALGIESDFDEIFIDDPRTIPRRHKIDIFRQILQETKIECQEFWVIGDNPESEIKAGKALGMKTIQRKSKGQKPSELADYKIESFEELERIIK
jgi:putative hydrolase of the HAD superfamily